MKGALLFLALFTADAALAQDQPPIPDFQTCMDVYMDRYEQKLIVNRSIDIDAVEGGLWDVGQVYTCGGGGIVLCDRSDAPLPCQRDLADEQDAMTGAVLADLPPAGAVDGKAWVEALYDKTYLLANGTSAGPDCDGMPEIMEVWCGANEANNRLRIAVLAWQIARWAGEVPSAVERGWARRPPAIRPRPRPEGR